MAMDQLIIEGLDHVAILVKDIATSVKWYKTVLGLKKYHLEKWGDYPIFLLANKSGLALFPADPNKDYTGVEQKITHFAFKVSNDNFLKARARYKELGLSFTFQDHHYFHSIYTKHPDGHTVELTTLLVEEKDFY